MLVYVAHCFGGNPLNILRAWKITHDLALSDPFNTYVCPLLTFMYLRYGEVGYEGEMSMCQDLLGECGEMVVASRISKGVQIEIDYCKEWGIPIEFYEHRGKDKCPIFQNLSQKWRRATAFLRATRFSLWLMAHSLAKTAKK